MAIQWATGRREWTRRWGTNEGGSVAMEGVAATVRCTGASLEVVFPKAGGPAELMEEFAKVREAFRISKGLSGLIV